MQTSADVHVERSPGGSRMYVDGVEGQTASRVPLPQSTPAASDQAMSTTSSSSTPAAASNTPAAVEASSTPAEAASEAAVQAADAGKLTVGFDLGTTYSCACVMDDGKAVFVPLDDDGSLTMASSITFQEDGSFVAGNESKILMKSDPQNTGTDSKHMLYGGRTHSLLTALSN
jgi:cytoskeletal protein RodZ